MFVKENGKREDKMETIVNIDLLNKLTMEGRNKIVFTAGKEFEMK